MKKIELFVSKLLIKIAYIFTYLLPIKKSRVSIISYFNKDYGLEFKELVFILEANNIEIKSSLNHFKATLFGKFRYLFSFIYQVYLFNTSSIVILDGNSYVYANIKCKQQLKTIQLWHAIAAIKAFGMQTNRRYQIKEYDYVIVSSNFFRDVFSKALNTNIDRVLALGNIKSDYLFDKIYLEKLKDAFYLKYPNLINKRLILYAPTFRGEGLEDINYTSDISKLNELLDDDSILIVKMHPLYHNEISNVYDVSKDDLYTLLYVSDIVISDYSALVFESIILNKKTILYLYDKEEYIKDRGLSINLDDLACIQATNIEELYDIINNDSFYENDNVRDIFLDNIDGNSTKRIAKFILDIMKEGF